MTRSYLVLAADDGATAAADTSEVTGADALVVDLVTADADPAGSRAVTAQFLLHLAATGVGGPHLAAPTTGGQPVAAPARGGPHLAAGAAVGALTGRVFVRINPGPVGHDDAREVLAVLAPDVVLRVIAGLWVARTVSAVQLDALDAVLSNVETERGLAPHSVPLVASLETAGALLAAVAIARAPRVVRLHLSESEVCLDLGLDPSPDGRELAVPRSHVVLASVAAGLAPPIASAASMMDGHDEVRASSLALRRAGFRGRLCVDPNQVTVVNEVFQPSDVPTERSTAASALSGDRAPYSYASGNGRRAGQSCPSPSPPDGIAP
jgi:citrate lyase subunit beta/citryl-CoA lyase